MGKTIGIDFGTTTSSAAYHDGVSVRLFETPDGSRIMPSAVSFKDGKAFVGQAAINELPENPQYTFVNIKRHLGEAWNENEFQGFQTVESPYGTVSFVGPDKNYTPEDLTALILAELKKMAEAELGPVTGAVITVPADCSEAQIRATIDAGMRAGFETVEPLIEPMAAALAYGIDKKDFARVAVYDFGGGTFDIAVMRMRDGSFDELEPLSIGDLGGADFDRRIANYVTDLFLQEYGDKFDGKIHEAQLLNVEFQSERAKKILSTNPDAKIRATFVARSEDGLPLHIDHTLTLSEFQGLVVDLIDRTIETCARCLELRGRSRDEIDEVLLVGGMTRVPAVQAAVEAFFGQKPVQRNPDTIVAEGAAIKAAQIDGRIDVSHQTTAHASYGIQNPDGTVRRLIPKGSPFGTVKKVKLTTQYDNQPFIRVVIVRGDNDEATDNELIFDDIIDVKKAKAGKPTIPMTLTLTNAGILEREWD